MDTGGYVLPSGASATFTFNGDITLGIAQAITVLHHQQPTQQIIAGRMYVLTMIGSGMVAETKVSATV
jgi:hypothetical protein